jgi:threonine dehydrogenase-like Zn-dependent dehydrogenase
LTASYQRGKFEDTDLPGAKKVQVETVADPMLSADDDILLRVTASAICGSDLHIYRGKIPWSRMATSWAMSSWGVVEDAGREVTGLRRDPL